MAYYHLLDGTDSTTGLRVTTAFATQRVFFSRLELNEVFKHYLDRNVEVVNINFYQQLTQEQYEIFIEEELKEEKQAT